MIGDWHIGVRSKDEESDELVRRALAHHLVPDAEGPSNYSVILTGGGRNKKIEQVSLLYRSSTLVVRSRTASRVLQGLFAYLSGHLDPPDGFRTNAVAAVVDGQAVMLPPVVLGSLKVLQPHLRRARWQLVDTPYSVIDVEAGELVVPDLRITVDESVVAELEAREGSTKEMPRVAPGRYPLRGWACSAETGDGALSRSMAVALTLPSVDDSFLGIEGSIEALGTLFSSVRPVAVPIGKPKELLNELRAVLRL